MTDTTPTTENRTLPRRLPNSAYRVREYLTEKEVERLIETARKRGRNSQRDAAAILLAYRHGLRAAELCALRWSQIDLRNGRLHVNRAKGGTKPTTTARWRSGVSRSSAQATRRNAPSVAIALSTPTTASSPAASRPSGRTACASSTRPRPSLRVANSY